MNAGKRGLAWDDVATLFFAAIAWPLFRLGNKLWRAVDDNLADFGDDESGSASLFLFAAVAALLLVCLGAAQVLGPLRDVAGAL